MPSARLSDLQPFWQRVNSPRNDDERLYVVIFPSSTIVLTGLDASPNWPGRAAQPNGLFFKTNASSEAVARPVQGKIFAMRVMKPAKRRCSVHAQRFSSELAKFGAGQWGTLVTKTD